MLCWFVGSDPVPAGIRIKAYGDNLRGIDPKEKLNGVG